MKIGQKIKSRREALKLSQEELAQRLNVTRSAISNWEIDRNYPDLQTLVHLSMELDMSLDELMIKEEKEEKRKLKLNIVPIKLGLALTVILLVMGSVFVYQKHYAVPKIKYAAYIPPEDGAEVSNMTVLFKEDIQSIAFDPNDNLVIKFTLSEGEKSGEFTLDGNVLTVMKEKCDHGQSEHDYVHEIVVDTYDHRFLDNQLIVELAENYLGDSV